MSFLNYLLVWSSSSSKGPGLVSKYPLGFLSQAVSFLGCLTFGNVESISAMDLSLSLRLSRLSELESACRIIVLFLSCMMIETCTYHSYEGSI